MTVHYATSLGPQLDAQRRSLRLPTHGQCGDPIDTEWSSDVQSVTCRGCLVVLMHETTQRQTELCLRYLKIIGKR